MKFKILISALIVLLAFACKRKSTDDYEYYQPAPKDTTKTEVIETPVIEEVVEIIEEPDRGVDLKNHNYFIVIATYTVEDFAKSQKKKFESQGYNPDIFMLNQDGWYRLAVESYKTHEEAKQRLNVLKEKGGLFSNARIVFKRN